VKLGLYYEGGPPPDVADRLNASFPNYLQKPIHQRMVVDIANDDKSVVWLFPDSSLRLMYSPRVTLDGLRRVGFRLNTGIDGSGFILLVWNKASGYYFGANGSTHRFFDIFAGHRLTRSTDVGTSQLIIDGKIKLKNDAQISRFTQDGLEFEDGSTLEADAVVFATG
jgi:hypothetical protein